MCIRDRSCSHCGEIGHGYSASAEIRKEFCPAYGKSCSKCNYGNHYPSLCKKRFGKANAVEAEERSSKASSGTDSENEIGGMGFFNNLKAKSQPSSSSSDSDHYDADRSSVSSKKDGENFGWFSMTMVNDNKSQKNKKKPKYNTEAVSYTHLTLPTNREV